MSKIANYLNEHMAGGVQVSPYIRTNYRFDGGICEDAPAMVAFPASTNDIRKLLKFAWQMAEKGHVFAVTPVGNMSDYTGASVSKGLILDTKRYMNKSFEIDVKQKQIRVQPGVEVKYLNSILELHGLELTGVSQGAIYGTIGGAIANAAYSDTENSWRSGMLNAVDQLEVILSTGEILQTSKLNKREVEKKKGLQNFEGDIYRKIDALLDDYSDVVDLISKNNSTSGYPGISEVRDRSGSINLAPLFIGSQGSLGVVSEVILQAGFRAANRCALVISSSSIEETLEIADYVNKVGAEQIKFIDGSTIVQAREYGKNIEWLSGVNTNGAILVVEIAEFSERAMIKAVKKISKKYPENVIKQSGNDISKEELLTLNDIGFYITTPNSGHAFGNSVFRGLHIPREKFSDFKKSIVNLSNTLNVPIILSGDMKGGVYHLEPVVDLSKVGERQKILKLNDALASYISSINGVFFGQGCEGRVKSEIFRNKADARELELYDAIKELFDPYGILNPGVKQNFSKNELAKIVKRNSTPRN